MHGNRLPPSARSRYANLGAQTDSARLPRIAGSAARSTVAVRRGYAVGASDSAVFSPSSLIGGSTCLARVHASCGLRCEDRAPPLRIWDALRRRGLAEAEPVPERVPH